MIVDLEEFATVTTSQTWFPPTKFVLAFAPDRVQVEVGGEYRVSPDFARHEGNGGITYVVRVTEIYPRQIERESWTAGILTRPARPRPYQYAACEILAREPNEHFLSHGHRTW